MPYRKALMGTCMQRKGVLYLVAGLFSLAVLEGVFYRMARVIPDDWYDKPPTRADYVLPYHSALSKRRLGLPYLLTVLWLLTYKRLYAALLSYVCTVPPWFAELYEPTHPAQALQVSRDILRQFARDAQRYGKRALIFVLPTAWELMYCCRTAPWSYTNCITMLHAQGEVQSVHLGPLWLAKVKDGNLCDYFCMDKITRSGHDTEQGHRVLAEVVQ
jgi:hypothetical protein